MDKKLTEFAPDEIAGEAEDEIRDFVFSDWVMFDRVMQNEEVCAAFLEKVLVVCLVLAVADMKPGQDYGDMLESYIVFLCDYDPLRKGLPVYTVRPACEEASDVALETGQTWAVLNSCAWRCASTEGLRNLLEYVSNRKSPVKGADPLVARIDAEVAKANRDIAWKEKAMGFMTLEMDHRARERYAREQGVEQGIIEGEAIGEERNSRLTEALLAADRIDDLRRAAEDASFRRQLYQELEIS